MTHIEQFKIKSGLSYSEIGDRTGLCKTAIYYAIKKPWRTSWETFKSIAIVVNMPLLKAEEEWKKENIVFQTQKFQ